MNAEIIPYSGDSRHPSVFRFGDHNIRVITINDSPWFVAADVCKALDVSNPTKAIERLDEDEYTLTTIQGTPNQINVISESGLYSLILTSRKDEAKTFKRWVTSEVLPAIRRTGRYDITTLTPAQQLLIAAQQLVEQEQRLNVHEDRIIRLEARATAVERGSDYFTIVAYCNYRKVRPPVTGDEALVLGRRASKLSRERGFKVGKSPDARYGEVNTYHIVILDEVFQAR